MAGADRFDTCWGNLTYPLDFTQAHPLQYNHPTAAPHVGDYLTVADTVPTPAPGQGGYYITSATYQGATRYGRKATAGHLSGRDPAVLPVCAAVAFVSDRCGGGHARNRQRSKPNKDPPVLLHLLV